jgi:hypothetical protein
MCASPILTPDVCRTRRRLVACCLFNSYGAGYGIRTQECSLTARSCSGSRLADKHTEALFFCVYAMLPSAAQPANQDSFISTLNSIISTLNSIISTLGKLSVTGASELHGRGYGRDSPPWWAVCCAWMFGRPIGSARPPPPRHATPRHALHTHKRTRTRTHTSAHASKRARGAPRARALTVARLYASALRAKLLAATE